MLTLALRESSTKLDSQGAALANPEPDPSQRTPHVVAPRPAERLAPEDATDPVERWRRLRVLVRRLREELAPLEGADRADKAFELWVASVCLLFDARGKGLPLFGPSRSGTLVVYPEFAHLDAHGKQHVLTKGELPDIDLILHSTSYVAPEREAADAFFGAEEESGILRIAELALREAVVEPGSETNARPRPVATK
jgi:hypothetical protein